MSHVSYVEIEIDNLKALQSAAEKLGLEFIENQKSFRWYGRWVNDYHNSDAAYQHGISPDDYGKCEHAMRVKGDVGGYEIGVIRKSNGKYGVIWDHWGSKGKKITDCIGGSGENLKKHYASETTKSLARRKGFNVQEQTLENGGIRLRIRKGTGGW